jgi:dipeptidyl aminopeptidase/acylaminoacyl peptidase
MEWNELNGIECIKLFSIFEDMNHELFCEVSSRGQTMRGFLHRPENFSAARRYPAVLFLHGLGGNHIESHRFFVLAARRLAAQNILAARFDFLGSGNSDGEFCDVTPDTELQDALVLLQWLQSQPGVDRTRIGLIGFSLGGLLATYAATRFDVKALCLWAATAHMYRRMKEKSTPQSSAMLKLRGWHDINGNKTSRAFFDSAAKLQPLTEAKKFRGRVLILHGEGDDIVPVEEAREYSQAFAACHPALKILPNADHGFNKVEWADEVIETTAKWLAKNL